MIIIWIIIFILYTIGRIVYEWLDTRCNSLKWAYQGQKTAEIKEEEFRIAVQEKWNRHYNGENKSYKEFVNFYIQERENEKVKDIYEYRQERNKKKR